MRYINLTSGNYEITLLTAEEYKRYKPQIPPIKDWWWLRFNGYVQDYAAFVDCGGYVHDYYGRNVDDSLIAVRPVLKSEAINLPVGEKFIALGNRWVVIGDHFAVSEDVITHRRYDKKSNDWETSELKAWLEEWAREGEYDE